MSESDTPRTDEVVHNQISLARVARQLERELNCAQENFHVTNQAYVKADARAETAERELAQSQARCAELEKDAARYRWLADEKLLVALSFVWEAQIPTNTGQTIKAACDAAIDDALKEPL